MRHAQFLYTRTESCAISLQKDVICMSTLGERLLNARKQLQLTQEQLANRLNVTRSTISNWERNISEPSFEALQQLSSVFGTDFLADFPANAPQQHENACIFHVNARESPAIEVISHTNTCNFSEITVDCSVNCVDQQGNALKFRLFAPFRIAKTEE